MKRTITFSGPSGAIHTLELGMVYRTRYTSGPYEYEDQPADRALLRVGETIEIRNRFGTFIAGTILT